jgi:GNAT superfamily N-acetyltransferase
MIIRPVESDADLDAYVGVWNAITPDEPTTAEVIRERRAREPVRLYVVAELDGRIVGSGFGGPSDSEGRAHVAPRVLPEARRRGIGSALLRQLVAHAEREHFRWASSHVDGADEGSLAFARRFGFEESDRQVEQVVTLDGDWPPPEEPEGARLVTIAERPELLREAYDLAVVGYADMAVRSPVTISLDQWLREEATLPEGSFVALAGDEIVGFSGLMRRDGRSAEDGLTVVRRSWRRRGLATVLKQAELSWAAANGVREIVTWTQRGNEGMRAVNERLGYVYRSVTISVRSPLPLLVQ